MKNLKIVIAILSLVTVFLFFMIDKKEENLSSKPLITTSSFAIYDLLKHIAKDKIDVVSILPLGVDPHSFEPTPKLIAELENSKLFFYSGAVLEPWTQNLAPQLKAIDLSKSVSLKKFEEDEDEDENEAEHEHEAHHHHHGAYDPHYWLDLENMKKIAQLVSEKLSTLDPKNKHFYEKNKDAYIKSLVEIDDLYKQNLLNCKLDRIVVTHNAFSYLADRYGFSVVSLTGLTTEAQPSAEDVKHILKEVQENNIKVVFFENFSNSKSIETIADDLNITIGSLQPLGNITADEADQNLTYTDIMRLNLEKIAEAMQCN